MTQVLFPPASCGQFIPDRSGQAYRFSSVSEISLSYKTKVNLKDRARGTSLKDAFNLVFDTWNINTIKQLEEFKILLMNP